MWVWLFFLYEFIVKFKLFREFLFDEFIHLFLFFVHCALFYNQSSHAISFIEESQI